MYTREIPQEHTEEITGILSRNTTFQFNRADLERLFFLYYKHIAKIPKGTSAMKQMQKDLTCKNCVSKVIYFFRNTYQ